MWCTHENFHDFVAANWKEDCSSQPLQVLTVSSNAYEELCVAGTGLFFGDFCKKKATIQQQIQDLETALQSCWDTDRCKELEAANLQMAAVIEREEMLLRNQARINWIKEGDRNSTFYHAIIKERSTSLKTHMYKQYGSVLDEDIFLQRAAKHFSSFITAIHHQDSDQFLECIPNLISEAQNGELCFTPMMEEVAGMVVSLNPQSSPGPDGFTGFFYIHCWGTIKNDVMAAISYFFLCMQIPQVQCQCMLCMLCAWIAPKPVTTTLRSLKIDHYQDRSRICNRSSIYIYRLL